MKSFLVLLSVFALMFASGANAKRRVANCSGDTQVDVPIAVQSIEILSPTTVHFVAGGGSDASGYVYPNYYIFTDPEDNTLYFPAGIPFGSSLDALLNITVMNFVPGETYQGALMCLDACGNRGYSEFTLTMPAAYSDAVPPTIESVKLNYNYFGIGSRCIAVRADDASGIQSVEFYFDNVLVNVNTPSKELRGITPGVVPVFRYCYPKLYYSRTVVLKVRVLDWCGNASEYFLSVTL